MQSSTLEKAHQPMIQKDTAIEDLVRAYPESVRLLREKGIKCIACGEPIWGTLEDAAKKKGFSDEDIAGIVADLNRLVATPKDPG